MGHFHVCDDSAAPCDDPEDLMVVALYRQLRPYLWGCTSQPWSTWFATRDPQPVCTSVFVRLY